MAETSQETGRLAKQADGSVVVRIGWNSSLCKKSKSSRFFTLNGRLSRKFAAAGRFPGGFFKEKQDQVTTKY
jgi:polyribonucleotide nucleotidyltransferase